MTGKRVVVLMVVVILAVGGLVAAASRRLANERKLRAHETESQLSSSTDGGVDAMSDDDRKPRPR